MGQGTPPRHLADLADRLAAALRTLPAELTRDAAQDALDVLAVAAGIKPLAVVGCGYTAPAFIEQVASGAVGNDLVAQMGHQIGRAHVLNSSH